MKFLKISPNISVSASTGAPAQVIFSAGRTRTVRVRYAHPHSAGFGNTTKVVVGVLSTLLINVRDVTKLTADAGASLMLA